MPLHPIDSVRGASLVTQWLTPSDCETVIREAEAIGFTRKVSKRPGPPIRDNTRALYTPSAQLTAHLEARLLPLLRSLDLTAIGPSWRLAPAGFLNTKWRINRYQTGESFRPHYDTGHVFSDHERTLLSVIAYLNDDFEGGETSFLLEGAKPVLVAPQTGAALIFHHYGPHSPLHATEPLRVTGRAKYVARTDVRFVCEPMTPRRLFFEVPPSVRKAVLLLGVPGAGKSTQLERLSAKHGWPTLNFGEQVRALKRDASALSAAAQAWRERPAPHETKWLPDALSAQIFEKGLPPASNAPLLLDGYPRRRSQSTQLETDAWSLVSAVYLKVSPRTQEERLATRAATERTTADLELRMQDWQRDTAPLVEHYRKRGVLDEIDAEAPVEAVTEALERIIERRWFERVFAFLPSVAHQALDGFTPHPVNLSKKYLVYRFTKGTDERYLKVVSEPATRNPSSYEGPTLAAVKAEGFPFDTPVVHSAFSMGPEVNGVISQRVPGITVKQALAQRALEPKVLVQQWARALATIHSFMPRRPEVFLSRSVDQLLALARQRLVLGVIRPQSFSAKYGIAAPIDLHRELSEVEAACRSLSFDQTRFTHGDPCAPNFIWSPSEQRVTGCVDLSGIGYADLHWDVAIACWSVDHNTSPPLAGEFTDTYLDAMAKASSPVEVDSVKLGLMYRLARFLL